MLRHRCPHCRHFREHYVQLARQVTTVALDQDVEVSVHAVSCTEYHDICTAFDVEGYPKIKLFKANETTPTDVHYWEAHPFDILKGASRVRCGVDSKDDATQTFTDHSRLFQVSGFTP
eukprot:scaffold1068_cov167-Amphora_coffeaeformis.AAC.35